jgi:RNA polymerase sigma-70 factor (ECF subfamily)
MATLQTFQDLRPRLVAIAYRMLGSFAEAEDAVQDTWLRWQDINEAKIRDPPAWLTTTVSRICIDRLTSARARRESYPGEWLPEPVMTSETVDAESISLGFLVVLERLNPMERASFVLHRVFDYSHQEVGEILGIAEASARQTFHRAQAHVAEHRPRFQASREQHQRLLGAFASALASGRIEELERVLAVDATLWADGGGKVRGAAGRPIHGANTIARFFQGLVAKSLVATDQTLELREVNGWPALVGLSCGQVNAVITIETDGEHITAIRNVVNPDKLALRPLS